MLRDVPLLKQAQSLSLQPFYQKGINAGNEEEEDNVSSEMKRSAVYSMTVTQFCKLINKIESVHASTCMDILESYKVPEACNMWIKREVDRKLPFQEKHVAQQASILGNLEDFGVIKSSVGRRGYLTQMLADCYGFDTVFLVERKSYKLKADRSLRQKESLILERLRIDIEDLNLNAVESLRGIPYLAIGKHLCGPATDLTLRCCLGNITQTESSCPTLGITKEQFHAITWFTSWAVDADHGSDLSDITDCSLHSQSIYYSEEKQRSGDEHGVEDVVRNMKPVERAMLGFKCKQIIDVGRMMWAKEHGLDSQFVKYVPSSISPENHLLLARHAKCL
ncbi:TRNA:M(4)X MODIFICATION ENZYME TRM13-like protein [Salix koriyanagi]|uniref:tRNA:m(4)X modification enzyme TRM13 n=1 Tax=Salix koriyanagi TaxID=2511006 RepID=A0A9Q0TFH8_9ROSI|nr:TRNA:M(4)X MODIFICATION ENZYME TRM13-like protein [Salix koriyanagi]